MRLTITKIPSGCILLKVWIWWQQGCHFLAFKLVCEMTKVELLIFPMRTKVHTHTHTHNKVIMQCNALHCTLQFWKRKENAASLDPTEPLGAWENFQGWFHSRSALVFLLVLHPLAHLLANIKTKLLVPPILSFLTLKQMIPALIN